MDQVVFRYRARQLGIRDIRFIQALISKHYQRGRSHICRQLCEIWQWIQPNGKLKECAARDPLLRLEEQGLIELHPRLRPKNNLKEKSFDQAPLFLHEPIHDSAGEHDRPYIERLNSQEGYLWDYLVYHHHYLGLPKLVGEYLKHLVYLYQWPGRGLSFRGKCCLEGQSPGPIHRVGRAHKAKKPSPDRQQYAVCDPSLGQGQIPGLEGTVSQPQAITC